MENILEFPPGGVPTKVAARVFGVHQTKLMNQMEMGLIDIGFIEPAQKKRGKRQYRNAYISPLKLYQQTGYIWRGEKDVKKAE